MADTKYLKQRGRVWWFQRAVPKALQLQYGKIIQETLTTSDLREAQQLRDVKAVEWSLIFSNAQKFPQKREGRPDPETRAYEILSNLRATLADLLDRENIPEYEKEGIDYIVPDMAEEVLVEDSDKLPLSLKRQVLQIAAAISERLSSPLTFDFHEARSLLTADTEASGKSMTELRDEFLKVKVGEGLPEKTRNTHERHLKALEVVGWDAQALKDSLEGKAPKTIENYLINIRTFSRWLQGKGVTLEVPKFKRQRFSRTRDVFTKDELEIIASSSMDETGKWICLVSVHQGMRMGEIIQLRYEDIREVHGYWCFDVNDHGNKKVKNPASIRVVPVHPWLIDNGFLEYWNKHKGWARHWASYDGSASQGFSKFINPRIRKALGLKTSDTPTGKKVFHSLRHTFRDHCREAGLHTEVIDRLGGWSTAGMGEGVSYGQGHSVKSQYESISNVLFLKG